MTRDGRQNDTPLLLGKIISLQVLIPTCFAPRITTATMKPFTAENFDKGNKPTTTLATNAPLVSNTGLMISVKCVQMVDRN